MFQWRSWFSFEQSPYFAMDVYEAVEKTSFVHPKKLETQTSKMKCSDTSSISPQTSNPGTNQALPIVINLRNISSSNRATDLSKVRNPLETHTQVSCFRWLKVFRTFGRGRRLFVFHRFEWTNVSWTNCHKSCPPSGGCFDELSCYLTASAGPCMASEWLGVGEAVWRLIALWKAKR